MRFGKLVLLAALSFGLLGLAGFALGDRRVNRPAPLPAAEAGGWLYRREPAPALDKTAVLVFTGDVMLGRAVSGEQGVFSAVAADLARADLAAGNLEGVLAQPGQDLGVLSQSAESGYRLDWPVRMAAEMQAAGFDLLSVANNHAGDRDASGLSETVAALERVGITPVGSPPAAVVYRTVRGVRLAFLGFNDVAAPNLQPGLLSDEDLADAVRRANPNADVVITLVHWGTEYRPFSASRQTVLARKLAAAGADLVIGSHPHVVQGSAVVEGPEGNPVFVAYSLGNFVFDQGQAETRQGAALWVYVDRDGIAAVQVRLVSTYLRPRWEKDTDSVLERMTPPGVRLAYACDEHRCAAVDALGAFPQVDAPPNDFYQGMIDLTGDGRPERIVRAEGRVTIYENEQPVWQSPADWTIYDVSLGDPNDDGRFEAVIVFEKVDTRGKMAGKVASHPFLIGYRGGRYVEVWGGSAVADPILEIALGDVDGDGRDDLVALEQRCPEHAACDRAAVTVWRWNGWGFSLLWRGPEGRLTGLSLCETAEGRRLICLQRRW